MCLPNKSWAGGQLTEEDIDFKLNECKSREEFIDMIERYVKFYNRQRPSYALGYDTPDNYYRRYQRGELEKKDIFSRRTLTEEPKFIRSRRMKDKGNE